VRFRQVADRAADAPGGTHFFWDCDNVDRRHDRAGQRDRRGIVPEQPDQVAGGEGRGHPERVLGSADDPVQGKRLSGNGRGGLGELLGVQPDDLAAGPVLDLAADSRARVAATVIIHVDITGHWRHGGSGGDRDAQG